MIYYLMKMFLLKAMGTRRIKLNSSDTVELSFRKGKKERIIASLLNEGRYEITIKYTIPKNIYNVANINYSTSLKFFSPYSTQLQEIECLDFLRRGKWSAHIRSNGKIWREKVVLSSHLFDVKEYIPWVMFEFTSNQSSKIGIADVSLRKIVSPIRSDELRLTANLLIASRAGIAKATCLLYADINLNVIDGSSIWLSSMASMLCNQGKCILISKEPIKTDVIVKNIQNRQNLTIISPEDFPGRPDKLEITDAAELARSMDDLCPNIRTVVVRGTQEALSLSKTRQFKDRLNVYLTDFYEHVEGGTIVCPEKKRKALDVIVRQARRLLVQTPEIARMVRELTEFENDVFELPPPINAVVSRLPIKRAIGEPVRIGYAGKIAPEWGILELFDWVEQLRNEGFSIELTMIGNKVSGLSDRKALAGFRKRIADRMDQLKVIQLGGLDRASVLEKLSQMDFVWCYRPALFEEETLELSTKLVEATASGFAALCYPNAINRHLLGEDYPFFITSRKDLKSQVLKTSISFPAGLSQKIEKRHSILELSSRFEEEVGDPVVNTKKLLVPGHDYKFVDSFLSHLKSKGYHVVKDQWEWGTPVDLTKSREKLEEADIVFCEWGLANAVWYSQNLPDGKELFVRIHLQEINPRAQKFGKQINDAAISKFIFVSERVRQEAIAMFGWSEEQTLVIPNYVIDDEYVVGSNKFRDVIRLGMVGIVPQRKRLDRAITVLEALLDAGYDATLAIKGPRPEELPYMHAPGRKVELTYFNKQYDRIDRDPRLKQAVTFHPWGNDVASWYQNVDFILSPSDFESFHYALADGILSGCFPIIWPWDEASVIYKEDWVVQTDEDAVQEILRFGHLDATEQTRQIQENRDFVMSRYGRDHIYHRLEKILYWRSQ